MSEKILTVLRNRIISLYFCLISPFLLFLIYPMLNEENPHGTLFSTFLAFVWFTMANRLHIQIPSVYHFLFFQQSKHHCHIEEFSNKSQANIQIYAFASKIYTAPFYKASNSKIAAFVERCFFIIIKSRNISVRGPPA